MGFPYLRAAETGDPRGSMLGKNVLLKLETPKGARGVEVSPIDVLPKCETLKGE